MAEVAALGLAANIVQFLDYGRKFVLTARTIYNNGAEGVELLSDLRDRSQHFRSILIKLQNETAGARVRETNDDESLDLLANHCAEILQKILDSLTKIELPRRGRKRDAAIKTFRVLWNQSELESLEHRLTQFQQSLNIGLAMSIRATSRQSLGNQEEILKRLEIIKENPKALSGESEPTGDAMTGFGWKIVEYVAHRVEKPAETRGELLAALIDLIHVGKGTSNDGRASSALLSEERTALLRREFLARLWHKDMDKRVSTIHPAHEKTFRWVFEHVKEESASWYSFTDWLESDDQVYWITGKPGSGKSTLMGYISQVPEGNGSDAPRSAGFLKKWAGKAEQVMIASFYFWAAGSKLQKSKLGLFRTLLYQLLSASPKSIPFVSPNRWELLSLFSEGQREFGEEELQMMVHRAVEHISANAKIALFIDGLDEFEGDPQRLLKVLRNLTSSFPIKLCVASRPWVQFENEFQSKPHLKLQDLTRSDIKNYVTAKFGEDRIFLSFQKMRPEEAGKIFNTVVEKGSGVFLWVTLVVNSLLIGLTNGDRVEDLEDRLALLPTDLEQLYDRIIDQIEPHYQKHASQYFRLMKASLEPPDLLVFSFADEVHFVEQALGRPCKQIEPEHVRFRLDQMRRRLNSRCKGLLEVTNPGTCPPYVKYLHRSVMEYVERHEVQEKFKIMDRECYDPNVRLLAAQITMIKGRCFPDIDVERDYKDIRTCMTYASLSSPEHGKDVVTLLDDFNGTIMQLAPNENWTTRLIKVTSDNVSPEDRFLYFATKFSVLEYVKAKMESGYLTHLPNTTERSSLSFWASIRKRLPWASSDRNISPLLLAVDLDAPHSAEMLQMILVNGANPNLRCTGCKMQPMVSSGERVISSRMKRISNESGRSTLFDLRTTPWIRMLWSMLLASISKPYLSEDDLRRVSDCARVMVDHGARINRATVKEAFLLFSISTNVYYGVGSELTTGKIYRALKDMERDKTVGFRLDLEYCMGYDNDTSSSDSSSS